MGGKSIAFRSVSLSLTLFSSQVYKGSSSSHTMSGLQVTSEYRFRACAHRLCQDAPELAGPYSPTVFLQPQRPAPDAGGGAAGGARATEARRAKRSLTDEQLTLIFILLFGVSGILIAFVIQYFVIK